MERRDAYEVALAEAQDRGFKLVQSTTGTTVLGSLRPPADSRARSDAALILWRDPLDRDHAANMVRQFVARSVGA